MPHLIYGLYDPRVEPQVIRYVGYTSKELTYRLKYHCSEAKKKATCHRTKWIASLLKDGVTPAIIKLELVTQDDWMTKERSWISKLSRLGNLTNSTAGGEGLVNPSQDVRDRIAKTLRDSGVSRGNQHRKGVAHTDEDKAKISAGVRNSKKFKEAMIKMRGINRHANMTIEQLISKSRKLSLARLACPPRTFSEVAKLNMSLAHFGVTHSSETKEKIRLANLGNTNSLGMIMPEDAKEAIRKARLGSKKITDGINKKFLKLGSPMPDGWRFIK